MNLEIAFNEIDQRIYRVDFSKLWRNFQPVKFALYNKTECYFDGKYIEKSLDFVANTTIEFNGEQIAIWELSSMPTDWDQLSASIIHEMFHAFQILLGESRWANEKESLFRYEYSEGNISRKLEEAKLISKALKDGDESSYSHLLNLRSERRAIYPY